MLNGLKSTNMNGEACADGNGDHRFALGLITGGALGLGLGMLLAPRSVIEMRTGAAAAARRMGEQAAEGYQQARSRVGDVADEVAAKAQGVRDDVADAVVRTAERVERAATHAKSGH